MEDASASGASIWAKICGLDPRERSILVLTPCGGHEIRGMVPKFVYVKVVPVEAAKKNSAFPVYGMCPIQKLRPPKTTSYLPSDQITTRLLILLTSGGREERNHVKHGHAIGHRGSQALVGRSRGSNHRHMIKKSSHTATGPQPSHRMSDHTGPLPTDVVGGDFKD